MASDGANPNSKPQDNFQGFPEHHQQQQHLFQLPQEGLAHPHLLLNQSHHMVLQPQLASQSGTAAHAQQQQVIVGTVPNPQEQTMAGTTSSLRDFSQNYHRAINDAIRLQCANGTHDSPIVAKDTAATPEAAPQMVITLPINVHPNVLNNRGSFQLNVSQASTQIPSNQSLQTHQQQGQACNQTLDVDALKNQLLQQMSNSVNANQGVRYMDSSVAARLQQTRAHPLPTRQSPSNATVSPRQPQSQEPRSCPPVETVPPANPGTSTIGDINLSVESGTDDGSEDGSVAPGRHSAPSYPTRTRRKVSKRSRPVSSSQESHSQPSPRGSDDGGTFTSFSTQLNVNLSCNDVGDDVLDRSKSEEVEVERLIKQLEADGKWERSGVRPPPSSTALKVMNDDSFIFSGPAHGPLFGQNHEDKSLAKPLHVQRIENALRLEPFLTYAESIIKREIPDDPWPPELSDIGISPAKFDANGRADRRSFKARMFNMTKVKRSRKWLKNIMLSDSSSEDEEGGGGGGKRLKKLEKMRNTLLSGDSASQDSDDGLSTDDGEDELAEEYLSEEDIKTMLKLRKQQLKYERMFSQAKDDHQYLYYGSGLLSTHDRFPEHQKLILGPKKKNHKDGKKGGRKQRKEKQRRRKKKEEKKRDPLEEEEEELLTRSGVEVDGGSDVDEDEEVPGVDPALLRVLVKQAKVAQAKGNLLPEFYDLGVPGFPPLSEAEKKTLAKKEKEDKSKRLDPAKVEEKRRRVWASIAKKEIPRAVKQRAAARAVTYTNLKRVSRDCVAHASSSKKGP